MTVFNLKHIVSSIVRLALLMALLMSTVLALVGLGFYTLTGNQETALWMCGVAFGTSVVLAPIAYWMFSEPSASTIESART